MTLKPAVPFFHMKAALFAGLGDPNLDPAHRLADAATFFCRLSRS
jgi:hypothetical protein